MPPDNNTNAPVTLDLSKSTPVPQAAPPVQLDLSKSVPIQSGPVAHHPEAQNESVRADQSLSVGQALTQAAEGVGGNLLELGAGLGGLVNKVTSHLPTGIGGRSMLPSSSGPVLPEENLRKSAEIGESLQQTPVQKAASFGTDVATIATGEGAVEEGMAGLSKLAAKYPQVMELMEKFPKASGKIMKFFTKTAETSAKQGTVMGAEQGIRESKPGGEGFVEGAKEGAIGGAIGGAAGEVAAVPVKAGGKALGITTAAEEDAMRALKPGKREYKFLQNWSTAKDRLVKEVGEDGTFENWPDAVDRIHNVADKVWNEDVRPLIDKHAKEDLFPSAALPVRQGTLPAYNPIAESIRDQMDKSPTVAQHFKKYNATLENIAKSYEHPMTVGEGERIVEKLNADLGKKGYWKLSPSEQKQWETADADIAGAATAARTLRKSLDDRLDTLVGGDSNFQRLKREYGALRGLETDARGQLNVQGRQAPVSMKKLIGITAGVMHGGPAGVVAALVPFADEYINNPTALLNRAVKKSTPDSTLTMATKGAAAAGAKAVQKSLPVAATIMFRASDGSIRTANADQWDEIQKVDPGAQQVHAGGGKK